MKLWKDFRTNLMYWRFRHITRNRLRLRSWWSHQHLSGRLNRSPRTSTPYAGSRWRGTATYVQYRSPKRTWMLLIGMVILLTLLQVWAQHTVIAPVLIYALGVLIVVGAMYTALRGT
ncbi:MAG: hypothetical protein ACRDFX_03810 [Chloroflexota bacterium]